MGNMTIGEKIRSLREDKGMLLRELASFLEIGEAFLSKVERNQKSLKRSDIKKLSNLFNVDPRHLEKLWLANKVYDIIENEEQGLNALKEAEFQYKKANKK